MTVTKLAALLLSATALGALAQPMPPPPPSPPSAAPAWGQTVTATQGMVARLLPTPEGEVDGLLLQDGSLVRFPPHMSAALLAVVGQGDAISMTACVFRMARLARSAPGASPTATPVARSSTRRRQRPYRVRGPSATCA